MAETAFISSKELQPNERTFFIERTGVILRWVLIATCSIVQFISPVIPFIVYWFALPVALLYNGGIQFFIKRKPDWVVPISSFSAIGDIVVSAVLIFFAEQTDIYLWYFVLLVSHAARFGFKGALLSPIIFTVIYGGGLYIRGLQFPLDAMVIRSLFFIITGVVSGYLAREEHRRFDNILYQQKEIFLEHQKRKDLRDTLKRYVSYNVVEELINHPEELKLGGYRRKVSVLFGDIQGFTNLLAHKEPEEIINQLNEYLTAMTALIFQYGGMVDKFVGDAIIGIFGALEEQADDSQRAVCCALSMQKEIQHLQEKWRGEAGTVFHARIAVNSGFVIMGNVGSPQRMDFTAIGDPVNTASRLQSVAEVGTVVISSDCYKEIADLVEVRSMGSLTLKGKPEPVEVFEVLQEKHQCGD